MINWLNNLLHCFLGMARVALQPKVHMVETDGLFPIQSWYGEARGAHLGNAKHHVRGGGSGSAGVLTWLKFSIQM